MALERGTVVRAALELLNEVGLDSLTVRRLAERLNVQNPALYWHFKNKQDLLNAMAETMLADAFAGIEAAVHGESWEAWLTDLAQHFHHALLAYRDGARVIAGADLSDSRQPAMLDMALSVLTDAGFSLQTAFVSVITIFDYTVGAAFEEQSEPSHNIAVPNAKKEPDAFLDPTRFPMLTAVFHELADAADTDRGIGFEAGLQLIIAGMRATADQTL